MNGKAFVAGRRAAFCQHQSKRSRDGVSIIEVLVTLAIISLLLALTMPALQNARASARRVDCRNRLRQLSLAAQQHVSTHRKFPQTSTKYRGRRGKVHESISPHARLLPYLEQYSMHQEIDWNHVSLDVPGQLPESFHPEPTGTSLSRRANESALRTTISVFLCPSDVQRSGGNNYRACMGYGPGIFGPKSGAICPYPGNAAGAFVNGRGTRPSEFTDGLSHTILFSEQLIGDNDPGRFTPWTDAFYYQGNLCTAEEVQQRCGQFAVAAASHDSYRGTTWLFGSWRQTWYNHVLPPNSNTPDCSAGGDAMIGGGNGGYSARSYHTGGVNVAVADGSARFVSENINRAVWQALSTRAGKESVGESF